MRILALDIGGTSVKYGLLRDDNIMFGQFPVRCAYGNEDIPRCICSFSKEHMPDLIAVSAPGPFDFETGTSHMTHKLLSMYNISLRDELSKFLPSTKVTFIHDSTAFAIGALNQKSDLKEKSAAVIMLGTGLGYSFLSNGRVLLNKEQTPLHPLWNRPFLDGISEDYVSTKALLSAARDCGCVANTVLDMAVAARNGNKKLLDIFFNYGMNLGLCVLNARKSDAFSEIVIGGQISLSFDLIQGGFEKMCKMKYSLTDNPDKCAIYGLIDCALKGKENYCIYGE